MLLQEKNERGFTLIELVTVIVLLSILGIFAFSRLGNFDGYEARVFYDEVVNAVRYAQKLAVSTGCDVRVNITATGFDVHQRVLDCDSGAFTLDVLDPVNRSAPLQGTNPAENIIPATPLIFTAQSTVTGIGASQTFAMNGGQFTVFQHTGLVDAQ